MRMISLTNESQSRQGSGFATAAGRILVLRRFGSGKADRTAGPWLEPGKGLESKMLRDCIWGLSLILPVSYIHADQIVGPGTSMRSSCFTVYAVERVVIAIVLSGQ